MCRVLEELRQKNRRICGGFSQGFVFMFVFDLWMRRQAQDRLGNSALVHSRLGFTRHALHVYIRHDTTHTPFHHTVPDLLLFALTITLSALLPPLPDLPDL